MHRAVRLGAAALLAAGLAACEATDMAPFGRSGAGVQEDSPTVRRVRGQEPDLAPLSYEPGTVWPAPSAEPPRALMPADPPPPPPRPRTGSPGAEAPLPPPAPTRLTATAPLPAPPPEGQRRLQPGTVLADGTVVTGEAARGVAATLSPRGAGLAVVEGPAAVVIGPGGEVRHLPAPR